MYFILALALGLRLVLINQSLWLDEAIQALALMGKQGALLTYALGDYQPPLYHLLGYLWTNLAGYSELSLRSISLFSGLATVYFLIKIGRDFYSEKVGLIVGLLSATNPLLIYYSQEGRTYALTTFLVTASMYYFMKLIKDASGHNTKYIILYTLFTILYLWTSYLSWFLLLSLFIYCLFIKRYDLAKLQVISAATLICWLPSLLSSLSIGNATRGNSPEWGRVVGGLSWKSLPLTWVKFVLGRISFVDKTLYAGIVLSLGALHLYIFTHLRRLITNYYLLIPIIIWLLAPIVLGIIVAGIIPVYQYFRVLFALPAYLLLLAISLNNISQKYSITIIFIQIISLVYFWFSPNLHRENWRHLTQDIPQSATVAMPSRAQSAPLLYYGLTQPILEPSHEDIVGKQIYYIRYVEDLFDTAQAGQKNFTDSGYTIESQKVYSGLQLDIYGK